MGSKILTVLKDVIVNGNTKRVWLFVNKTPLMQVVAWFKRKLNSEEIKKRSAVLDQFGLRSTEIDEAFKQLEKNGYVLIDQLLSNDELQQVENYVKEKKEKADQIRKNQTATNKDFWVRLSDDVSSQLTTSNLFIKISLNEKVLSLVGRYLGQVPYLDYVLLTLSQPSKNPLKSSQLWHLDKDNDRMLKMFIYFTDVLVDGDGPFTFLPLEDSKNVKNSFAMKHLPDDKVFPPANPSHIVQMKGKKWTTFLCDTSRCYHMGSRLSEGHERLMLTSLYLALPSIYPDSGEKVQISKTSELTPLQQAAISWKM